MTLDEAFAEAPLVAILRGVKPEEVVAVADALVQAGVRLIEVPLNSPSPLDSIRNLSALGGRIIHGAGTVLSVEAVDAVEAAGGTLIVSPNTNPAVIAHARVRGLEPMPGFGSASEAFAAYAAGARRLKLFPAGTYGVGHVSALRAVLPGDAKVLPVGGVTPADMADWWRAGAAGFGLGGELYKPGFTPEAVHERAVAAMTALRALTAKAAHAGV